MDGVPRPPAALPLERGSSLAQRAYDNIRESIRDGRLRRGVLYSENELGTAMGISRTPVREALLELSRQRVVEILPQRGFRLRAIGPEEIEEVFHLREALEGYVVRSLAASGDDEHIARLTDLIERQREAVDDPETLLALDEEFHLLMPMLLGLHRTHDMIVTVRSVLWLIGNIVLSIGNRAPEVIAEHAAIVDAIARHDPDLAERAIKHHLDRTLRAFNTQTHS